MQVVALGPFVVNLSLLLAAASALAGYIALAWRLRTAQSEGRKETLDRLLNLFIVAVLIWKFSPLVLDFPSVVRHPVSLLYFTGGTKGLLLAGVYALGALLYGARKRGLPLLHDADAALTWLLAGLGVHRLLAYSAPLEPAPGVWLLGETLLAAVLVGLQLRAKRPLGEAYPLTVTVMWYGIGRFALTLPGRVPGELPLGFTGGQLALLVAACLSFVIKILLERRNEL
ncbi:hypothetical protein J31TS4_41050 [Paenibacillus sp. J31TS4]|uniref:hypothetical protein n=1 Tax=Paenibacillus sp. J31TS4 TaxID=2807195 RepID=UPI001B23143B|nr:hypothetical protein [Paenibacillus sp. J31TS4]GIP40825.1 hypothetical protein J31TS4_41050 [Paenibacillus sp. J31TS4]